MHRQRFSGFTIIELLVVMAIAVLVAAFAIPNFLTALHTAKLRGAASNFSGLLQSGRIRAVQDNRFYSTYILNGPPTQAYVDIYPQKYDGTSGNGGTSVGSGDPAFVFSTEITPVAAGSAPDTTNLKGLFLPAGSLLPVHDGSTNASPVTFSPRGLPCTTQSATGGTVCDSAGGATAFWVFFENNVSQEWEAVTVSPSGRIQKWRHGTGGWSKTS
jgi:prepilin-type N-terminal cleavage/methylation domain-containing protein